MKNISVTREQALILYKHYPELEEQVLEAYPDIGGYYGVSYSPREGRYIAVSNYIVTFDHKHLFPTKESAIKHAEEMNLFTEMATFAAFRNGDWVNSNKHEEKFSLEIKEGVVHIDESTYVNTCLFRIVVKSRQDACDMKYKFQKKIKEIYNL